MHPAGHPDALLRRMVAAVLRACRDTVFPGRCLECRDLIPGAHGEGAGEEEGAPGAVALLRPFFCAACLQGVMPLDPPLCPRCGVMFKGRVGVDHLCGRCREQPPPSSRRGPRLSMTGLWLMSSIVSSIRENFSWPFPWGGFYSGRLCAIGQVSG